MALVQVVKAEAKVSLYAWKIERQLAPKSLGILCPAWGQELGSELNQT
jgi:hypothetical protein